VGAGAGAGAAAVGAGAQLTLVARDAQLATRVSHIFSHVRMEIDVYVLEVVAGLVGDRLVSVKEEGAALEIVQALLAPGTTKA
jgi:hypothetical protein